MLPPEPGSAATRVNNHVVDMVYKTGNMKRHLSEGEFHKKAWADFEKELAGTDQTVDGAVSAAARKVLERAKKESEERKNALRFGRGYEGNLARVKQEMHLLAFFAEKGISFNAVESE